MWFPLFSKWKDLETLPMHFNYKYKTNAEWRANFILGFFFQYIVDAHFNIIIMNGIVLFLLCQTSLSKK